MNAIAREFIESVRQHRIPGCARVSVAIWRGAAGECICPGPHSPDVEWTCHHWWECEFGRLEHSDPRPDRGQIGPLMLTTPHYLESLLKSGPCLWLNKGGRVDSASVHDGREFMHVQWRGQRWTWELFDAYFRDKPAFELLVGRWPD